MMKSKLCTYKSQIKLYPYKSVQGYPSQLYTTPSGEQKNETGKTLNNLLCKLFLNGTAKLITNASHTTCICHNRNVKFVTEKCSTTHISSFASLCEYSMKL